MALTVWDPFTALSRLDREFDELVRRAWSAERGRDGGRAPAASAGYVPAIEMATEGEDVVLRLELPGIDVDSDVDIEVANGRLTISGQRTDKYSSAGEAGRVLVRELRYGAFRREFALPDGVGADDIEAAYDRGMLEVRIRRLAKPAPAPTKVAIRAGGQPEPIEGTAEQK